MQKNIIEQFYERFFSLSPDGAKSTLEEFFNPNIQCGVAHPVNDLNGIDSVFNDFFAPLLKALPKGQRNPFVVIEGDYEGRHWINSTGCFVGNFAKDLFGIPASSNLVSLRYTEMVCIENQQITEIYLIPDFIDLMNQVGANPLRQSLGRDGLVLPPATGLALGQEPFCAQSSEKSVQLVEAMLDCLGRFDGKSLASMDLENYWHQDFIWYGPGSIGTTRGVSGFRNRHQGPFVFAFPDRRVSIKLNVLAHNNYVATGGWPHMFGTHTGSSQWLGLPATGQSVSMRVMDIWRREGGLLKENWVAIDIAHILLQLGYDLFAQMTTLQEGPHYG